MDELIVAIDRVAEALQTSPPAWISVVGIVVPIVLTVVSIILSVRMDKNNEKMQKMLANRDMMNQTRQCILNIYNAFYTGAYVLAQADKNVAEVFSADQSYYRWGMEIENASKDVMSAYNQAKLLVEDEHLLQQLKEAKDAFVLVNQTVGSYICTGIPAQTIMNAWLNFSQQYNVQSGNYYALFQNRSLGEIFIKLCENTYTKDIQEKISAYLELVNNESFDKPFKVYVQIREV